MHQRVRTALLLIAFGGGVWLAYASWNTGKLTVSADRAAPKNETCAAKDIDIKSSQTTIVDECPGGSCTFIRITGEAVNRCTHSTGVKLRVIAKDNRGEIVESAVRAMGNVRNIPPGASRFEISDPFAYQSRMATFELEVVETRQWK